MQPDPKPTNGTPIADLVIDDIQKRKQIGIKRYGVALQAHNGRDALLDAYEESLDQTKYLKQALVERADHRAEGAAEERAAIVEFIDGLSSADSGAICAVLADVSTRIFDGEHRRSK
ncbi:hypothetical protein WMF38_57030 [Sorangium sp. So ce118]